MVAVNEVGQTFQQWKHQCDKDCRRQIGQSIDSLPKWCWWDRWHEDFTPEETLTEFFIDNSDVLNVPV